MKTKIVLWGNDAEDKKVLLALELKPKANKVDILQFSEEIVTEEFYNQMMDQWRTGKEVVMPEGYETITRELSMTEDILPETIKVQRADLINRAKTEWHFVVLSTKLYDLYSTELSDLKEKIDKLVEFDGGIWEETKSFWAKISEQSRERNLFREHADELRDNTNSLFTFLKELKTKANAELAKVSKGHVETFAGRLDGVKEKVEKGMSLGPLFDELKKIQNEFKNADFTRNDRSKVWKKIDEAFKIVKEKKYGKAPEGQQGAVSRIERRYQGLKSAIGKMEASIRRDRNDIDFQTKRANTTMGQLEMQIRQAKVKMVEERINSKQVKLDEMLATKVDLEKKVEKEKARAEKNAQREEVQKKKAELKKQIDSAVSSKAENLTPEEAAKLAKAASLLNKPAKTKAAPTATAATANVTDAKDATEVKAEAVAADATKVVEEVKAKNEEVKKAVEASKTEGSKVDDTIEKAKSTLAETKEAVADKAKVSSDAKETVVAKVADAKDAVSDKVVDAKDAVVDKAADAKDAVADKVTDAKELLTDKAEEPKESMLGNLAKGGLLAGAVALGAKLMDKAEDVAEDMGVDVDGVKAKMSDAKEAISDKYTEATEGTKLGETIDSAKEKMNDVAETVSEKTEDLVDSAKEKIEDVTDTGDADKSKKSGMGGMLAGGGLFGAAVALGSKVMDTVSDKIEDAAESLGMEDALDSAKEKFSDAKDAVTDKVAEVKGTVEGSTTVADASVEAVAGRVREEAPLDLDKLEKNHKKVTSGEEE